MKRSAVELMSVPFTHVTILGAIGVIAERIARRHYSDPLTVFTPNVEILIQADDDAAFLADLKRADVTIPDSVGLVMADWWRAALTGKSWQLRERVAGFDVAEKLLLEAAGQGWKVVLVGGIGNTAEVAVNHLKRRFETLNIWWAPSPADVDHESGVEFREIIRVIDRVQPDIVLVGFGAPKQERWVLKHKAELATQVAMTVGGVLDVWAGKVKRAPQLVRKIGFEWLWRLIQEPQRAKRQTRLGRFIWAGMKGKW